MTFHNVIILLRSVVNKYESNYYYNIFLEKGLYKDKFTTWFFKMNVWILQILYFDRIDFSEGTDVNKTGESKESDVSHYW